MVTKKGCAFPRLLYPNSTPTSSQRQLPPLQQLSDHASSDDGSDFGNIFSLP